MTISGHLPYDAVEAIRHSNPIDPMVRARINMRGPLNRVTGYGNHFVELVLGLLKLGVDIRCRPVNVEPPLLPEILATMTEPWGHTDPIGIVLADVMHLERVAPHTIGITVWETTKLPPDHRTRFSAIDEFIVPCQDNIAMLQQYTDSPVHFVPEGVDTGFFTFRERDWSAKPLKLCMFGSLSNRKGLDLAVEAFADLYADDPDVELHLGTTNFKMPLRFLTEGVSNIHSYAFGWQTREEVRDWFYDKHALFMPVRGEGFYLPGAEFMATGGIFIGPQRMGPAHYHNPTTGWVIPSRMDKVRHWHKLDGAQAWNRFGEWIDYDLQDVKNTLHDFVSAPVEVKREKAENASAMIGFLCDPVETAQKVLDIFLDSHLKAA